MQVNLWEYQGNSVDVFCWLCETWGPPGGRWDFIDLTYVTFNSAKDLTLFNIMWG